MTLYIQSVFKRAEATPLPLGHTRESVSYFWIQFLERREGQWGTSQDIFREQSLGRGSQNRALLQCIPKQP